MIVNKRSPEILSEFSVNVALIVNSIIFIEVTNF